MRCALANGFPMVMVHENDDAAGGCEFARFFETTPQALATTLPPDPNPNSSPQPDPQAPTPTPAPDPNPTSIPNPNPTSIPNPTFIPNPTANPNPLPQPLTPNPNQDLIADGLYKALAYAWYPDPFRQVSVALV